MDVQCERCASHYDFDESRISSEGLSVKCSSCGHVFRVFSSAAPVADGSWMVRQASGNVVRFKEMTTLQRWIVERKVSRQDQISKTGRTWKNLGDIAELSPFFLAVDAQRVSAPAARPTPQHHAPHNSEDDFDDLEPAPRKRRHARSSNRGVSLLVIFILAVGALAAAYVVKPELFTNLLGPSVSPLAAQHLESGKTHLHQDSFASIERAREDFERALTITPNYPEAKAYLAQAELNRAEYLLEEAEQMFKRAPTLLPAEQEAIKGEIDKRRAEAKVRIERAFLSGKDSLMTSPEGVAANRVLADYYRIMKAPETGRSLLERARVFSPRDAGVAFVFGATLMNDATLLDRAVVYLTQALETEPKFLRARYKLARTYLMEGKISQAQVQAETILKAVPDHERAQALLFEVQPPPPEPILDPPPPPAEPVAEDEQDKKELTPAQLVVQADRLREVDQPERAKRLYQRAIELAPEDPDAFAGLGWSFVDLDEPDNAVVNFRRALAIAPRLTDAHMGLAEAFRLKGMRRDAIKHYRMYLDILPNGPEALVAKRMIADLQ